MDVRDLLRPNVRRLVAYSPGRSARIKLASNENPLGPSPLAIAAMREAAPRVLFYPDPVSGELTQALAEHWHVSLESVVVGRGSDEVIHMLGLAFLNAGEQVIYSLPAFALYPFTTTLMDCEHVAIRSREHVHDLDAMADAVTDKTKLIFIGNPCNPTGTIVTRAQFDAFMERVPERVVVVMDEAYHEYTDAEDYPDSLDYVRAGRNVIVLRTFSKIYALAGLRLGYGIANPALTQCVKAVCEPFNVPSMAQVAGVASLKDPDQVARSRKLVAEGKHYMYNEFDQLGLCYIPSQANFIFVNVGIDSEECFSGLAAHDVAVRTGNIFGPEYTTFIRVSIGTMDQNEAFIAALHKVLGR